MHSLVVTFAIIGVLGVGAQWLAWRLRLPAIVLMLIAGVIAGPFTGWINPEHDFGDALGPMVSVAVALILFEGGLSLDIRGLRDAGGAVKRIILLGAPLGWITGTLACHYVAGLSWPVSAVFGGILVVTGPTVVTPLLRQAKLTQRPASVLRWEAIVNDSIGALFAVLAFEYAATMAHSADLSDAAGHLVIGVVLSIFFGGAAGLALAYAFRRALVPEYMKVPVLIAVVLGVFAASNEFLEESGLLAVTLMGMILGNSRLPSIAELRRFKEHIAVLLVSGVFVILAATLDAEMLATLNWRALLFVITVMLIARPIAVWLSLAGTNLSNAEKGLIAWVGPRGVVAVAISGFFGTKLAELGYVDGAAIAPLAFALVFATVVIQGFSVRTVAQRLDLVSTEVPGVLIVGASNWSAQLAKALQKLEIPILVVDKSWAALRRLRLQDIPTWHGEILSEAAEHTLDLNRFGTIIAATDNDSYNALICTDFGPEFGRTNVFQLGRSEDDGENPNALPVTLGGRKLFASGVSFGTLESRSYSGWVFTHTRLTEEYGYDNYRNDRAEGTELLADLNTDNTISFVTVSDRPRADPGDVLLSYAPAKSQSRTPESEAPS